MLVLTDYARQEKGMQVLLNRQVVIKNRLALEHSGLEVAHL